MLIIHLYKIRKRYTDCLLRITMERNSSGVLVNDYVRHVSTHQYSKLQGGHIEWVRNLVGNPDLIGIFTTKESKEQLAATIRNYSGLIRIAHDFEQQTIDESQCCIKEFFKQLGQFKHRVRVPDRDALDQSVKTEWSGKGGPGENDDLVMAGGFGLVQMMECVYNPEFHSHLAEIGKTLY